MDYTAGVVNYLFVGFSNGYVQAGDIAIRNFGFTSGGGGGGVAAVAVGYAIV
jgi:hypothetical protein